MKVLVIGSSVCDVVINVNKIPKRGEDEHILSQSFQVGGCAFNVVSQLQFFDIPFDLFSPIGKGIYGTYFAPGIDGEILDDTYDERGFIECGYLQIILKGGLINLILLLAIFIPAIFKGYKSSNNTFSKVAASIIAVYLIDLLPFGLPVFDPKYIMVWMCVSICYNKDIRKMSNEEIRELLISQ